MAKLWIHEFEKVNGEWLLSIKDLETLRGELEREVIKIAFIGKFSLGKYLTDKSEPIIFCRFIGGYLGSEYDMDNKLSDINDKENQVLREYNDQNTCIDLVLFDDVIS